MRDALISLALMLGTGTALADRPLTQEESDKLNAALKQEGCSGGKMEFEYGNFEVERGECRWQDLRRRLRQLLPVDQDEGRAGASRHRAGREAFAEARSVYGGRRLPAGAAGPVLRSIQRSR